MPSYNKVIVMGNLTRDPEMQYTPNGAGVCKFSLAMNRKFKVQEEMREEVCFVEVTVWGKQAESCAQYLSKGRIALVEGRLTQDTWDDKDTGAKRSKLFITADNVQFMSPKEDGQGGQQQMPNVQQGQQQPTFQPNSQAGQYPPPQGQQPQGQYPPPQGAFPQQQPLAPQGQVPPQDDIPF